MWARLRELTCTKTGTKTEPSRASVTTHVPLKPATVVTARRPVSPGLAHAALTDDEDLQGGQHVLVHPDPAPYREQPAAPSAPQPFPPSSFIKRKKLIFLGPLPLRQTQRSPEGPRHLHRIPRLSEAPWEVP